MVNISWFTQLSARQRRSRARASNGTLGFSENRDLLLGIGDDHEEIGTNAVEIVEKLSALSSPDGILVLMDLGSAILSTEMALDMVDDEIKAQVRMCPAPFVEGAIAAGVQANMGSNLEAVYREAMASLLAKQQQIQPEGSEATQQESEPAPATVAAEEAIEVVLPVTMNPASTPVQQPYLPNHRQPLMLK